MADSIGGPAVGGGRRGGGGAEAAARAAVWEIAADHLVGVVNAVRAERGLSPVAVLPVLRSVATERARLSLRSSLGPGFRFGTVAGLEGNTPGLVLEPDQPAPATFAAAVRQSFPYVYAGHSSAVEERFLSSRLLNLSDADLEFANLDGRLAAVTADAVAGALTVEKAAQLTAAAAGGDAKAAIELALRARNAMVRSERARAARVERLDEPSAELGDESKDAEGGQLTPEAAARGPDGDPGPANATHVGFVLVAGSTPGTFLWLEVWTNSIVEVVDSRVEPPAAAAATDGDPARSLPLEYRLPRTHGDAAVTLRFHSRSVRFVPDGLRVFEDRLDRSLGVVPVSTEPVNYRDGPDLHADGSMDIAASADGGGGGGVDNVTVYRERIPVEPSTEILRVEVSVVRTDDGPGAELAVPGLVLLFVREPDPSEASLSLALERSVADDIDPLTGDVRRPGEGTGGEGGFGADSSDPLLAPGARPVRRRDDHDFDFEDEGRSGGGSGGSGAGGAGSPVGFDEGASDAGGGGGGGAGAGGLGDASLVFTDVVVQSLTREDLQLAPEDVGPPGYRCQSFTTALFRASEETRARAEAGVAEDAGPIRIPNRLPMAYLGSSPGLLPIAQLRLVSAANETEALDRMPPGFEPFLGINLSSMVQDAFDSLESDHAGTDTSVSPLVLLCAKRVQRGLEDGARVLTAGHDGIGADMGEDDEAQEVAVPLADAALFLRPWRPRPGTGADPGVIPPPAADVALETVEPLRMLEAFGYHTQVHRVVVASEHGEAVAAFEIFLQTTHDRRAVAASLNEATRREKTLGLPLSRPTILRVLPTGGAAGADDLEGGRAGDEGDWSGGGGGGGGGVAGGRGESLAGRRGMEGDRFRLGDEDEDEFGHRGDDDLGGDEESMLEQEASRDRQRQLASEREELLRLLAAEEERKRELLARNQELQRKLARYFSVRESGDEEGKGGAGGTAVGTAVLADAEKQRRYQEKLSELAQAQERSETARARYEEEGQDLHRVLETKEVALGGIESDLHKLKDDVLSSAVHSRTGRPIEAREKDELLAEEGERNGEVTRVRIAFLHTRTEVSRLQEQLRARESVGENLALIDFEQLKIENATVHEKIEDRQEELRKLRAKTTTTVQVLTHVKEKLHFVKKEADHLRGGAASVEGDVARQRELLAKKKRTRETLRTSNEDRRAARGFAHHDELAVDFDRKKREAAELRRRLAELRERHAALHSQTAEAEAELLRLASGSVSPSPGLVPSPLASTVGAAAGPASATASTGMALGTGTGRAAGTGMASSGPMRARPSALTHAGRSMVSGR